MAFETDIQGFPSQGFPVLKNTVGHIALGTLYKNPLMANNLIIDVVGSAKIAGSLTLAGAIAGATTVSAANFLSTFTTTATAAGTTTLVLNSAYLQYFTGVTTQTVLLPTTSVPAGTSYQIVNNSTGLVTVQSSGANTVLILAAGAGAIFTALIATPTTAANWDFTYFGTNVTSAKVFNVSNSLTLTGTDGTTMTFPTTSATLARTDASNIFTGHQTIEGVTSTGATGTGNFVFDTSPTLVTAVLGSSTATTQAPADNSTKVATTAYVDNAVLGQNFKEAALVATTANLVGVYLSGVFTYTATGTDNIDGVNLALGNRVLVKNQTTTFQNGIYVVTTAGSIGVAGVLTRASDANASGEFKTGDALFVTSGTVNASTTWAYTGIDSPTLGTDAITYAQIAGLGSYVAGNGLTLTSNSFSIDTSITVDKTTAQTLTSKTLTSPTLTTPVINGTATGTGVSATPTASIIPLFDANKNLSANSHIDGYTTTVQAGGTTTLTVGSTKQQYFTGSAGQTVILPVTSTLVLGQQFTIYNLGSVNITIQSSGANNIFVLNGGFSATFICILTSGTTAASWTAILSNVTAVSGKSASFSNALTMAGTDGTTLTFPSTSATIARTDAAQTFTGTQTFSLANTTPQTLTVTSNAATADITHGIQNFTNSSAAAMTITLTTTSAVDGQWKEIRIYDFSAVAQTITWVNTENSTVTAPATSNGSTTLPLSGLFQFNGATSKWRCMATV